MGVRGAWTDVREGARAHVGEGRAHVGERSARRREESARRKGKSARGRGKSARGRGNRGRAQMHSLVGTWPHSSVEGTRSRAFACVCVSTCARGFIAKGPWRGARGSARVCDAVYALHA
eukprot:5826481-Pleurochrysis_carterae.AAC.2